MKKTAVLAAALALVLSLAACGNKDNNTQNPGNQTNGAVNDSGANGVTNGENGGTVTGGAGDGSLTDPNGGTGTNNGTDNGIGTDHSTGTNGQTGTQAGNDLRDAADDIGDAVSDLVDSGRNALSRVTSATTTFEQMLDNARVRDTDGVLADGENGRW